ncbi:oligopeptide transporter 3-like [Malus domestica]|uniref:oligopeptide transporter 3-like n=1 Tax=Malus domestica TaxID=3750 RepID=UPI003975FD32
MSASSLRRPSVASQTQISMALMLYETQLEDHSSEETSWRITVQKKPSWRTTIRMKPKSRSGRESELSEGVDLEILDWIRTFNPAVLNRIGNGDPALLDVILNLDTYFPTVIGYGWAGILRKYLVDSVEIWWPSNVAQVSLFRALHEKDHKAKGLTPMHIIAQQIGSGYSGFGVGVFTFDWARISAYHGSPLVTPWTSILNDGFGFVIFIYIIMPLCYWKFNTFDAQKFPIFSSKLFTFTGHKYDITKILTPQFDINIDAYNSYGKLSLSQLFALSIGSGFARFTATLVHVALFHGIDILKQSKSAMQYAKMECGLERESIP